MITEHGRDVRIPDLWRTSSWMENWPKEHDGAQSDEVNWNRTIERDSQEWDLRYLRRVNSTRTDSVWPALIDLQLTSGDGRTEEEWQELDEIHRNMMKWWDVGINDTKTKIKIALTTSILSLRCVLKSVRISRPEFLRVSPVNDQFYETTELEHHCSASGSNRRESIHINMTLRCDSRVRIVAKSMRVETFITKITLRTCQTIWQCS